MGEHDATTRPSAGCLIQDSSEGFFTVLEVSRVCFLSSAEDALGQSLRQNLAEFV